MRIEPGLDRLVAFSDAVVAIAITLVVLPLVDTARDGSSETVPEFLRHNAAPVAAAALSFVVIASLWRAHHTVFGRFRSFTPGMMRMNFLWLAAIVFLPLPTVLIVGTTNEDPLGVVIYIGTIFVATLSLATLSELAHRAGAEEEPDADTPPFAARRIRRWVPTALLAIALVLAAVIPGAGTAPLLVLLVAIPAERIGRRRARSQR